MEVYPALDLIDGRAVRLLRGRREDMTVVGDPEMLAHRFAADGASRLHVVDLEGAFDGAPRHLELVARLARILPVQLGGGLRTPDDVRAALEAGADRLILGTAAVETPALLDAVPASSLVVGVDVKDGRVAVRGWREAADLAPAAFARALVGRGVTRILCTAVHRDGTLEGPDLEVLREVLVPGLRVIASGGVGSPDDLRALAGIPGIEAAVVGKALYGGAMTFLEAREAARC
jgi:phosphoribosylformimino-5-aminoimidazole carboxamide ribotide isomerase